MRSFVQEFKNETDESLVALAQRGDSAATEELLLRYKNAVLARARKFFLAGGETDDLVQEGMIGLYTAICVYDPTAGKRFKNFAYLCVTRRIYDALRIAGRHVGPSEELDPSSWRRTGRSWTIWTAFCRTSSCPRGTGTSRRSARS